MRQFGVGSTVLAIKVGIVAPAWEPTTTTPGSTPACYDLGEHCHGWAHQGFCDPMSAHWQFMLLNCAATCGLCALHGDRCARHDSDRPALGPPHDEHWSIASVFERGASIAAAQGLHVTVRSRSPDPFVVVVDDFLSEEEVAELVSAADDAGQGWRHSKDRSALEGIRTSDYVYCTWDCLRRLPAVEARLYVLTGVPSTNTEFWELLRYREGQHYDTHHDFIDEQVVMANGPRIFTVLLYLSGDGTDESSGTEFPDLEDALAGSSPLRVAPKRGRALWFQNAASVPNYTKPEPRARHRGLPLPTGAEQKLVASVWLHLYDYRTPYALGCARQQDPDKSEAWARAVFNHDDEL